MSLSTPLDKADANRDLASSMEDDGEKTPVSVGWRGLGVGDLFDWEIAVMLWFLFPKQNYEGSSCCLSRKEVNFKYYGACLMVWLAWAHSFTSKQYQYFPENGVSSPALKFCNVCRPVEILRRRVVGAGGKSFRH